MKRGELQRVLGFVLLVMVCGGGCVVGPARWVHHNDLSYVGLDDRQRDRLNGLADPRPSDPQPRGGLHGDLMVYGFTCRIPSVGARPEAHTSAWLPDSSWELAGIESVQHLNIHWVEPRGYDPERKPMSPASFTRALLEVAGQEDADLLLVYAIQHEDSDRFDVTLNLAQFLTLGLAPTTVIATDARLEAALIDAETGFIYAILSGDGDDLEVTNFWNRHTNKNQAQNDAVNESLGQIVKKLHAAWPDIKEGYR